MRKISHKIAIAPILALLILSLLPTISLVRANPSDVYVDPASKSYDTSTGTIGTLFNVSVRVHDVVNMASWQTQMWYDISMLNVTRWYEPTWDPTYVLYGHPTLPVPGPVNPQYTYVDANHAWVGMGSAFFPSGPSFSGNGILCIITFNITALPGKLQTLSCALDIHNDQTFYIDTASTLILYDVYTNGSYSMEWKQPPAPVMAVSPTPREFGPWENVIGWKFNETALVKGLDPAWGLINASFCLCYNTTLIDVNNWWVDSLWQNSLVTVTHTTPYDEINVSVWNPIGVPGGDVAIIEIEFVIMFQDVVPPRTLWDYDITPIQFCGVELWDAPDQLITPGPPINGQVKIYCFASLPLGWMEVIDPTDGDHDVVLGPAPSVGQEFNVQVIIKNMHPVWHMVSYQLRVCFDPTLMQGVSITLGPFLNDTRWNLYGTLGISRFDPETIDYPACAVLGQILWPNALGWYDQTIWPTAKGPDVADLKPAVNPVLATIRFRAIKQMINWPTTDLTCDLTIRDDYPVEPFQYFLGVDPATNVMSWIPHRDMINGTYTMLGMPAMGKVIDLYGGVEGYDPYPAPYGGQGLNEPMDLVWPQKDVILYAKVTYNFWPVQNKIVGFEVQGPYNIWITNTIGHLTLPIGSEWTESWPYLTNTYRITSWHDLDSDGELSVWDVIDVLNHESGCSESFVIRAYVTVGDVTGMELRPTDYPAGYTGGFLYKTSGVTDENGVARITFRMPWQCFEAEQYFGIYKVTATVDIACDVVIDTTYFHYDYQARIFKVTTDKFYYNHEETVIITVTYGTHAMQTYPALFFVAIKDELDQPIGYYIKQYQAIGGAVFSTYQTGTFTATIYIPKWAFAGYAHIYVDLFDKDPTEGGIAYCPEWTHPTICILSTSGYYWCVTDWPYDPYYWP
jgi:hypothetical protein